MKRSKWKLMQYLTICFVVCNLLIMFFYWYTTGTTPLGWDTPKYIYEMRLLKEKGPLNLITLNYAFFLYSLIGGGIALLFNISPYHVEIYYPIFLLLVLTFTWYHLAKKWFKSEKISTLTFFFTLACFSTFSLSIFRHANLLGFIFALIGLTYVPKFYREQVSKKYLASEWGIFLLGGLAHPHTIVIVWGILFLTTLLFLLPKKVREKVGIHCKVEHNRMKKAFKRTLFVASAVFFPVIFGTLGQGQKLVYKQALVVNPFKLFFYRLREVFLDFGGFMIVFFSLGVLITWRKLKQSQRDLKFKEGILFVWTFTPLFLLLCSLFFHFLTVYARRTLLLLPAPLLEALGVRNFLETLGERIPIKRVSSLGLHKKTQMGILFTGLVVVPTLGTNFLIFDRLHPARRYISAKTIRRLKSIGENTSQRRKPIFIIFTPKLWKQSRIKTWDDWIRLYVGEFYIYPGSIHNLSYRERPRMPADIAQWYYKEMKEDGLLNNTEKLKQHKIYVLPGFYRNGNFTTTEKPRLHEWKNKIYLLDVSSGMVTSSRQDLSPKLKGRNAVEYPKRYERERSQCSQCTLSMYYLN